MTVDAIEVDFSPPPIDFAQIRRNSGFSTEGTFAHKSIKAKASAKKTSTAPRSARQPTTQKNPVTDVHTTQDERRFAKGASNPVALPLVSRSSNPRTPLPSQGKPRSHSKRTRSPSNARSVPGDIAATADQPSKRPRNNTVPETPTEPPMDGNSPSSKDKEKSSPLKKTSGRKVRGLKTLDPAIRFVVEEAVPIYRVKVATKFPFPSTADEQAMATDAIIQACLALNKDIGTSDELDEAARVLTARGSQMRGELKTKAAPIVAKHFVFDGRGSKKAARKNRELAEILKTDNRIISKDFKQRLGIYRTPILQEIINEMWFADAQDEGVILSESFKPVPLQTIALVLTVF
ncbi:hypothetical protein M422DRAFT_50817 [Sphaerobolus stellatus SS14]|uniref:DUF6532 domain-containing protein n=1 Tax=Sphaerobolus stellatus (strain SS14) TaxID=990650 RepID=A0A0C9UPZ5_SPHS4|nr:hypothetical protein M422DRAFT_50817 [Sphaerobolus stellatus SS14]